MKRKIKTSDSGRIIRSTDLEPDFNYIKIDGMENYKYDNVAAVCFQMLY